jgi:hypothetical protein
MGHLRAYHAAVGGKRHGNKALTGILSLTRHLILAAAALLAASIASSTSYAQAGPFAGLAGNWSGGGTVTLDDGSSERIRCRATYRVNGPNMDMTLTCASDAYKFALQASVVDQGGTVSGNWSETSRNVGGTLQGRGGGGNFQVVASTAAFNARISLRTAGNRQTVDMNADSQFRTVHMSLSK